MDEAVFNQLKELSNETHQDISELLNEAVIDLVNKKGFRPEFGKVVNEIMKVRMLRVFQKKSKRSTAKLIAGRESYPGLMAVDGMDR